MGTILYSLAERTRAQSASSRLYIPLCLLLLIAVYFHVGSTSSHLFTRPSQTRLVEYHAAKLDASLQKCAQFVKEPVVYPASITSRSHNPRWNNVTGQKGVVVLHNVTLFDGERWSSGGVNLVFEKGIITKISPLSQSLESFVDVQVVDVEGRYVTPGLVDMHSHHLVGTWPGLIATEDTNEMNDRSMTTAFGPLTPFVRSLDSIKPYDVATDIIRSGGVTSSLILPGSANIMGGEAYVVKNVLRAGKDGEENVEELLLEYGVSDSDRRRYMKMACGENPSRVYQHTRMGNSWIFRKHMERSFELKEQQDAWCLAAEAARDSGDSRLISSLAKEGLPEQLELDSSIGMLRGQVDLHNHCYEPEDFQAMLRHSSEFGFSIRAFHHALSAWKVPEMIKASGQNITIATFSDFGFYKQEGYEANLYAGKILEDHGIPVAYKSDHVEEATNAKYLLFEAQNAHSFGMSEHKALQAVTSVPAESLRLGHRIGYATPGYDADLVVWNSHPLSVGATPLQVYIDGRETLDEKQSKENIRSMANSDQSSGRQARTRPLHNQTANQETCESVLASSSLIITGITRSYLDNKVRQWVKRRNLTMVLNKGEITCFDSADKCVTMDENVPRIHLANGHTLQGLTAVATGLGLEEIAAEKSTADGKVPSDLDISDPKNLIFARYGIHLEGKAFGRARIGGVARAVSIPHVDEGGFGGAVSVGIKISEKNTTLDGGIFQSEVALHFVIGKAAKKSTETVSAAIAKLRNLLAHNSGKDNIYSLAVAGGIPLVIHTENKVSGCLD
jgi:imidazolonepropionase-like amidohydrolase